MITSQTPGSCPLCLTVDWAVLEDVGGGEGLWGRRVRHLHDGHPDCSMQEGAGHLQMKKEEQCC